MHWQGCVHEVCMAALDPSQYSQDITYQSVHSHTDSFGSRARREANVGVRIGSSTEVRCQVWDCCWKEGLSLKMELGTGLLEVRGLWLRMKLYQHRLEEGRKVQGL